ncbi:unnamed protein product [Alopecurus aequalis]
MRLSHCESYCADPLCYIPCLPKSKDASPGALSSAAPCPVEDKPPPVQKIESVLEAEKDGDGEKTPAAALARPPPKSNLKKPNCGADGDACAPKGNVKWLDLLGKDLTEVKEFEPSESGDSMDDGADMSGCVCVIQ